MNYEGLSDAESQLIKFALHYFGEKGEGVPQFEFDNLLSDDSSTAALSLQRQRLLRMVGGLWFPTVHAMALESDVFKDELSAVERVISLGKDMLTRGIERMPFEEVLHRLKGEFPKLNLSVTIVRIFHGAFFELEPFISVDSSEGNFVKQVSFRASLRRITSLKDIQREQREDAEKAIKDVFPILAGTKMIRGPEQPAPLEDTRLGTLLQALEDACRFDPQIRNILVRDTAEVQGARKAKLHKCVLLLCGSILEGVLVSILSKRGDLAQAPFVRLRKNKSFPEDASLPDLLVLSLSPLTPDLPPLLGQGFKQLLQPVIDHRDLIHPHREIRMKELKITEHSAELLYNFLCVVLHELTEATKGGWMTKYEKA